jgi:hypothetical protein
MALVLWFFITVLAACRPAFAQTTTSPHAPLRPTSSTPSSSLPTFEIDIIFPRENETYNSTSSLPIVFAFQNLSAAAELGSFRFIWTVMPYHSVCNPIPGGVLEDTWEVSLSTANVSTFANADGSPYVLVNHTNPVNWDHRPNYGGTAYAVQWYIVWDTIENQCDYPRAEIFDHMLFTILPQGGSDEAAPNPSVLGNVTGNCAQLGSVGEVDAGNSDICSSFRELSDVSGNSCALKPDEAMVSSISSAVGSLSMAQSLAAATPTTTSTTSSTNVAVRTGVPVRPAFAVAMVFGVLELFAVQ